MKLQFAQPEQGSQLRHRGPKSSTLASAPASLQGSWGPEKEGLGRGG